MKKKIMIITIFILLMSFNVSFALTKKEFDAVLFYYGQQDLIDTEGYNELVNLFGSYSNFGIHKLGQGDLVVYLTDGKFYYYSGVRCNEDVLRYRFNNGVIQFMNIIKPGTNIILSTGVYEYAEGGIFSDDTFSSYKYNPGYETVPIISEVEEPDPPDFQATLPAIYQETNLEEVMAEVIGVLPIVLICLVSWIGLRKALAFLSTYLKQS